MIPDIILATSDDEILSCFPVMSQLRPHLEKELFVERVRRQFQEGYELACLIDDGAVRSVAGFRLMHNLASGKILYVDDLVTVDAGRSKGYGKRLLDWLIRRARDEKCETLELDSGVQRHDAHRFYFVNRMIVTSHHFRLPLHAAEVGE